MHLVSLDRVGASVEGRTLFADASFGLSTGQRVGLVGPNGSGKSTLLRILAGVRDPDAGDLVARSGTRTAFLPQDPDLPDVPAHEAVAAADPTARPDEVERLLAALRTDPDQRTGQMSGGQRRRVDLARVLLPPSDLLVLDEPTNHLDVDTIDWLEAELARHRGCVVMVTHDRYLLERVADRMLDVRPPTRHRPGQVVWHEGSYSSLLQARAETAAQEAAGSERARNLLRKEVAWLQRAPKARTSKPKFRIEQAEALRDAAATDPESQPLDLGTGRRRLGNDVLQLEDVTVRRGERTVLDGVDLHIGPGERVAIVGPNGAGKSTLLHVLAGRLTPDAGTVKVGSTVHLAVYDQELTPRARGDQELSKGDALDLRQTVLDSVLDIAPHVPLKDGTTLPAGRLAERFGFDGTLQRTRIGDLSGGERRRVALLHVLVEAPNVLLLDEPTNDLDLDTLAVLEDHLDGFTGTLIVASHDRYTLDRLTDRTLAVGGGRITEHLDWASSRAAQTAAAAADDGGSGGGTPRRTLDNKARQAARKEIRKLETRIATLDTRRGQVHAAMIEAATDPDRLRELQAEETAIAAELSQVEETWLERSVELDD